MFSPEQAVEQKLFYSYNPKPGILAHKTRHCQFLHSGNNPDHGNKIDAAFT